MHITAKTGLLAAALGLFFVAGNSSATIVPVEQNSNAVNYCQAFTPGVSNTLRNRVVGVENTGNAKLNVACNFDATWTAGGEAPSDLDVYFSNTSTEDITVSCSLLTGYQGDADSYVSTKSVVVPAGATSDDGIDLYWSSEDNPEPESSDLGSYLIGINCSLPHGGVINDIYLDQNIDNGSTPV